MTETVLGIDPGEVTGWSLWLLDRDVPIQRIEYGLIKGGVDGFITWMEIRLGQLRPSVIVCERFNTKDGRVAVADLTPLPIEGALKAVASALALEVVWQYNSAKDLCRDDVLKRFGYWITPAQAKVDPAIDHIDARDVNDSQAHVLGWAKGMGHTPTIELLWPPD